jgi:CRISPR-associated protein Cmr2
MAKFPTSESVNDAWLERILQLLHDPPGKVKYLAHHEKLSRELTEAITGLTWSAEEWKEAQVNRPDAIMAGADRPCLPWALRQHFNTVPRQLVTHPLGHAENTPRLLLSSAEGRMPVGPASGIEERAAQREAAKRLLRAELAADGNFEAAFYRVWRRFRDELIAGEVATPDGQSSSAQDGTGPGEVEPGEGIDRTLFWSAIPADTRCPDVSIWDHTRQAAALSFMNVPTSVKRKTVDLPAAREPWLLQISLSGVQSFVNTARTSRDYWVGSFLFSDLSFHAMLPIIEQYGATAIIYPELWRNPRMDAWLKCLGEQARSGKESNARAAWDALPAYAECTSFAAVVPNSFVAVVPYGNGSTELPWLRELANEAKRRVAERWGEHAKSVRNWLERVIPKESSGWQEIWDRQHEKADIVGVRWTAVPWLQSPKMKGFVQSGALPWQDPSLLPGEDENDRKSRLERAERFADWISKDQWTHTERTRYAFGRINPGLLQMERGFEYAVTNAKLRAAHQLRKQAALWPASGKAAEGGAKCSLCGQRSALVARGVSSQPPMHIDELTAAARVFWKCNELDPEGKGAERLCAVCATKRFIVKAGGVDEGINPLWGSHDERAELNGDGAEVRVPFPSTTAICAQDYIAEICRSPDPEIQKKLANVVSTHRALDWSRTQFPRCLRQLAELHAAYPAGDLRREFLMCEPQELLYPDAIDAKLRVESTRHGNTAKPVREFGDASASKGQPGTVDHEARCEHPHLEAVRGLIDAVECRLKLGPPTSRLAVLKIDGDGCSKLLTGAPGKIHARWRDVLHPELVKQLEEGKPAEPAVAKEWQALLTAERMMGPSLHAFVTRALGEFAHRIAPWVVEAEYNGRLIYAGGDDLLALVPADQALSIAARLEQLYSAAWLVDTTPQSRAWAWRRPDAVRLEPEKARQRFLIPLPDIARKELQLPSEYVERHVSGSSAQDESDNPTARIQSPVPCRGQVIPMLGRGQSLSAGIVYAHMKDPLGAIVKEAEHLLKEEAKRQMDGSAVAMSWRSRGGSKLRSAMRWTPGAGPTDEPDCSVAAVNAMNQCWVRVMAAYSSGTLSRNLPYKLREYGTIVKAITEQRGTGKVPPQDVLDRLVSTAADGSKKAVHGDVASLWAEGFRYSWEHPEHAADGLAICRALAAECKRWEQSDDVA